MKNVKRNVLQTANYLKLALITCLLFCSCQGNSGNQQNNTADANTLIGAGSTFDYPLFSKQFAEYHKTTGLKVNYQSIGSGGGILQLINKTVDFGASDAPLNEEQTYKAGAPVLHIPVTAGAVVLSYNLPGVTDTLKLSPGVLAGIFLGEIKKWNDPKLSTINPDVTLPDLDIVIVHRSDGSGTTNIFTTYLGKVSAEWGKKVGEGSSIYWPTGLGGKGNEGVAGLVKQIPGAIGYVELAYALPNNMAIAKVQNKAGNYIFPDIASVTAAANMQIPQDARISLTNTDAVDGYPIAGLSWIIIYREQGYNKRSADKVAKLIKLTWWQIHEGQQYSAALFYAPLSQNAVAVGEQILRSATYDGKVIIK